MPAFVLRLTEGVQVPGPELGSREFRGTLNPSLLSPGPQPRQAGCHGPGPLPSLANSSALRDLGHSGVAADRWWEGEEGGAPGGGRGGLVR